LHLRDFKISFYWDCYRNYCLKLQKHTTAPSHLNTHTHTSIKDSMLSLVNSYLRLLHDLGFRLISSTNNDCIGKSQVPTRVARWYIFKPKIPICVNFGGPLNGKGLYLYSIAICNILREFGIFYGNLVI
jgi:hypothetical protein